jgi:hypothetical protein
MGAGRGGSSCGDGTPWKYGGAGDPVWVGSQVRCAILVLADEEREKLEANPVDRTERRIHGDGSVDLSSRDVVLFVIAKEVRCREVYWFEHHYHR